jgi:hypothetical protein
MAINKTLTIGSVLFIVFFGVLILTQTSIAPDRAPASLENDVHQMDIMLPTGVTYPYENSY